MFDQYADGRDFYDADETAWMIVTDSEYVVKGVTEWLPKWKVCVKQTKSSASTSSSNRKL